MTLREQLMLKRTLRRLRTWAPPISMGVIIGAGAFLVAERLDPVREPIAVQPASAVQYLQRARRVAHATISRQTLVSQPSRAYRNCDEARASGADPLHLGDSGYGPHLDADRDGIACEPYPR